MTYRNGSAIPTLPEQSLSNSSELFQVYGQTPGYTPILVVASIDETPIAKLQAVIRRSVRIFPPSLIKQCEIFGIGEYFNDTYSQEELFGLMLEHLTNEVLKDCFLIEFRNLPTALFGYKHFRRNGYFPINWIRVYNSLHNLSPEERLESKRKRQINRSFKYGVTLQEAQSEEDKKTFLQLLKRNYSSKWRKHFPDTKLFQLLTQGSTTGNISRIFTVKYKNRIIGGSFCMYSCDRAYLCFSFGLRKTFAWLHPNTMAIWAALIDAYQRGYPHFEFIDAGLPFQKVGYRNFILSFGGKQVSTRRWFRFRWEWINKLFTKLYQ
jgi:hypothetical protein